MPLDLFAGIAVRDLATSLNWYERLFGSPPSFLPNDAEAVWALAPNRHVFIEHRPEHAGHSRHLLFVDDLDAYVEDIVSRGLAVAERETYSNGVRKASFRDPDGNQFEFGGGPV